MQFCMQKETDSSISTGIFVKGNKSLDESRGFKFLSADLKECKTAFSFIRSKSFKVHF